MPSSSKSQVPFRFFKVMMPGFHAKLLLPLASCPKLKEEIPEQAFLTSSKGTWRVEVGKCANDGICFDKGWDNFVEKHDLKMGEFVVFEQVSRMHFEVSIYDTTSCKKNPSAVEVPEEQELLGLNGDGHVEHVKRGRGRPRKRPREYVEEINEDKATSGPNVHEHAKEAKSGRRRPRRRRSSIQQNESPGDDAIPPSKRGRPSNAAVSTGTNQSDFVKMICNYNVTRSPSLYIPGRICRKYHITERTVVSLRGPSGKSYEVEIKSYSMNRLCMRDGWTEFIKCYNIKAGDVCHFRIIRTDTQASSQNKVMMDVDITKC